MTKPTIDVMVAVIKKIAETFKNISTAIGATTQETTAIKAMLGYIAAELAEREWQPIETAPRDGRVIMSWCNGIPVFISYLDDIPVNDYVTTGFWPFAKRTYKQISSESGWRILCQSRYLSFAIHGNFEPFNPTHWQPIPQPPKQGEKE